MEFILDRKIVFILALNANLALPKLGFPVVRNDLLYCRPFEATLACFIHSPVFAYQYLRSPSNILQPF
jgi:hypothetical protein